MLQLMALALCALLSACAVSPRQSSPQDAPDRSLIIIGPHPPVSSLQELWAKTPVVVVATVQDTLAPQIEPQEVFRFQILDVQKVLKDERGSVPSSRRIKLKVYGGTVRVGGRTFVTNYLADPILDGEEAILFLAPLDDKNAFQVPYGATGTFPVDQLSGTIFIESSAARRMPEIGGRERITRRELMTKLRALAAAR